MLLNQVWSKGVLVGTVAQERTGLGSNMTFCHDKARRRSHLQNEVRVSPKEMRASRMAEMQHQEA